MANNYLQFSMTVSLKSEAEREWCRESLEALGKFLAGGETGIQQFATDIAAVVFEAFRKEWSHRGFDWSISPALDKPGQVAELWLHADESGDPEHVAAFLRAYLTKFNPTGSLWFSWAYTCSKMRVNEFGGGGAVVTASRATFIDTQNWASRRAAAAEKRQRAK